MGPSDRFTHVMIYWTVWDRFIQVLYLGIVPRTKETLPDFLKWRRVTRHPLVFRGLTGSQRTPGFWGVTICSVSDKLYNFSIVFEWSFKISFSWGISLFSKMGFVFSIWGRKEIF